MDGPLRSPSEARLPLVAPDAPIAPRTTQLCCLYPLTFEALTAPKGSSNAKLRFKDAIGEASLRSDPSQMFRQYSIFTKRYVKINLFVSC
jgi:hypothetical protein